MNSQITLTSFRRDVLNQNPQTSLRSFMTEQESSIPTAFDVYENNYVVGDSKGSIYVSQRINRILEFTEFRIFNKCLVSLHVGEFLVAIGEDMQNNETTSLIKFLQYKDRKLEEKSQFLLENIPEIESSFISRDYQALLIANQNKLSAVRLVKPKLMCTVEMNAKIEFCVFLTLTQENEIQYSLSPEKNLRVAFVQTENQQFLMCLNMETGEYQLQNLEEIFEISVYRRLCMSENIIVGVYKQNYMEQLNVKDSKRISVVNDIKEVEQIVKNVFLENIIRDNEIRELHSFRPGEFIAQTEQQLMIFTSENRLLYESGDFESSYFFASSQNSYAVLSLSPDELEITEILPIDAEQLVDELASAKLFDEALKLALDPVSRIEEYKIAEVREMYAKELFDKNEFERACDLYIETINSLEPSVVVRQFLSQSRTKELVLYLEALHEKGEAVSAHTNLLMNCYAKNGDQESLKKFVRSAEENLVLREIEPEFEVQLAVENCQQEQELHSLATEIAAVLGRDELAFRLFCEEKRFKEALSYLRYLSEVLAAECICEFGELIIDEDSAEHYIYEICENIVRLCVGQWQSGDLTAITEILGEIEAEIEGKEAEESHIILEDIHWAKMLVEGKSLLPSTVVTEEESRTATVVSPTEELISVPQNIESFVHLFISPEKEIYLVQIMNELINNAIADDTVKMAPQAVETYFELLIKQLEYEEAGKDHLEAISPDFIFTRLQSVANLNVPFSYDHLLILFEQADLKKCIIFTLQKLQLSQESVRFFAENDQFEQAMEVYRASNAQVKSELYPDLLEYAATHPKALEIILKELKNEQVPPLTVLEILTNNNINLDLASVFDYLYYKLSQISDNSAKLAEKLEENQLQIRENTQRLADMRAPKEWERPECAKCGILVDAPAVYVRCGHAFHERCWRAEGEKCTCWVGEDAAIAKTEETEMEMDGFETFADLMNGLSCGCFK